MLKEMNEIEAKVYKIFRSYKSFARMEYIKSELGLSEEQAKEVFKTLEEKGYLQSNKLGHYKETVEAQKARLGGKTASQYVAEAKAEQHRRNGEAFLSTFNKA